MYGYKDVYFNQNHNGFRNSVWIELIGFDNEKQDYNVSDFLQKTGFIPDMISFHLTSIAFVMTHQGMDFEYRLPDYACSYCGHDGNDDRLRQKWTNYQLAGLIHELHRHNIKVYISMFDFDSATGIEDMPQYTVQHPELMVVTRYGNRTNLIHMLKSFSDGTQFETVFIEQLKKTIRDYGLDGIQLADGVSSPRLSLQEADYSAECTDGFLSRYGIILPDECVTISRKADFIFKTHRPEWIEYNTERWAAFMDHVIHAIRSVGAQAAFNSAWTKGPVEAVYRYGTDYKSYENSGADSFIVEDVSADLFFLANSDNGFDMKDDRRKFIHYEFASNMMQLKAYLPKLKLTPLCMIRDTLEQWDVLHHMPIAMQRAVGVNLSNFYINEHGAFAPITNGPHYCLGDGVKASEWDLIRMMWDNAFVPSVYDVCGVTVVWSDKKYVRERDAFTENRNWYNGKWTAELMSRGAAVHKIARIENLSTVRGPILVINRSLLDDKEKKLISAYNAGEILYLGLDDNGKISFSGIPELVREAVPLSSDVIDPHNAVWTASLTFMDIDDEFVKKTAEFINEMCGLPTITEDFGACHVNEVMTSANTSRLYIDNENYFYATPWIKTKRKIKSIKIITKPDCYPIQRKDEYTFHTRVPGFGMDIAEVIYH